MNVVMKKGNRAYFSKTTILKRDLLMWKKTCICKKRPIKETYKCRAEERESRLLSQGGHSEKRPTYMEKETCKRELHM